MVKNKLTLNRRGAVVEGLACCRPASREAGCCHVTREKVETGWRGTMRSRIWEIKHGTVLGLQVQL